MEPIQVTPPPDHYAGLGIQEPGARREYPEVIVDPEHEDNSQVCIMEFPRNDS